MFWYALVKIVIILEQKLTTGIDLSYKDRSISNYLLMIASLLGSEKKLGM